MCIFLAAKDAAEAPEKEAKEKHDKVWEGKMIVQYLNLIKQPTRTTQKSEKTQELYAVPKPQN